MNNWTKPRPWHLGRGPKPREQRTNLLGEPLRSGESEPSPREFRCCGYSTGFHAATCRLSKEKQAQITGPSRWNGTDWVPVKPKPAPAEPPKSAGEEMPAGWRKGTDAAWHGRSAYERIDGRAAVWQLSSGRWGVGANEVSGEMSACEFPGDGLETEHATAREAALCADARLAEQDAQAKPAAQPSGEVVLRSHWRVLRDGFAGKPRYAHAAFPGESCAHRVFWNAGVSRWDVTGTYLPIGHNSRDAAFDRVEQLARESGWRPPETARSETAQECVERAMREADAMLARGGR